MTKKKVAKKAAPKKVAPVNKVITPAIKYEFTGKTKIIQHPNTIPYMRDVTLRQIKRLSDGCIGGWIESEKNLSHDGECFVYNDAMVFDNAKVIDDALVFGHAMVYEWAEISNAANVADNARIYACAKIRDNAHVFGYAQVWDKAEVFGWARVYEWARVFNRVKVYGRSTIHGKAFLQDDAEVFDNAQVYGDSRILNNAKVYGDSQILGVTNFHGTAKGKDIFNAPKIKIDFEHPHGFLEDTSNKEEKAFKSLDGNQMKITKTEYYTVEKDGKTMSFSKNDLNELFTRFKIL